jgi:branched-chain amino acid aminotransferase
MKTIDISNYLETLSGLRKPWHESYYALYSSLLNGIVRDPILMQVPIDDHLVHRGDGVFDTFKCVHRAAYNLEAHLSRLIRSGASIGLSWPGGIDEIRSLTLQTLAETERDDCYARVMLARGPGSFGVSPYESPSPALYIVVYALDVPFMEQTPGGASVRRSQLPVKPAKYATIKNCNYLPNVMMKREAVDGGVDFTVGFDDSGFMAEGATENFGIVTRNRELLFPRTEAVLDGTTMGRVMKMAEGLVASGELSHVAFRNVTEMDVRDAAEMLIVGTTINVVSVRLFEGVSIGDGVPGPVGRALNMLLKCDIEGNESLRTRY